MGFFRHMMEMEEAAEEERKRRAREEHEDDEDSTEAAGPEGDGGWQERCAICFRSPSRRPLATLPCCGADGAEEMSTTRFCADCVLESWKSKRRSGMLGFLRGSTDDAVDVGECPRCRAVIAVCRSDKSFERAGPPGIVEHAFHSTQYGMKPIMFLLSFLNRNFVSVEMFDSDSADELLRQLAQWGLLTAVNKKVGVYRMDAATQLYLYHFMMSYGNRPAYRDDDGEVVRDPAQFHRRYGTVT